MPHRSHIYRPTSVDLTPLQEARNILQQWEEDAVTSAAEDRVLSDPSGRSADRRID